MIRYLTELSLDAFTEAARNIPYQQIHSDLFPGIDLWIRRDDLIDPLISGNKAYKLIFNLLEARAQGKDTIITCGGAWSNHIHATAAAGQRFGFKTIGIIRGERPPVLSAMLQDVVRFGMELRFVTRAGYRTRSDAEFLQRIGIDGTDGWFVPEGGANQQGGMGVEILGKVIEETSPVQFDECWVPCGTGLTLGALAAALPAKIKVVGVPVLRAEQSIRTLASEWVDRQSRTSHFELIASAHLGGYAKRSESSDALQGQLELAEKIALEPIYTAKLFYTLVHQCKAILRTGNERQKTSILIVHTGGLQGRRGMSKNR